MRDNIILFFRKSREGGNFSIERSFNATIPAFNSTLRPRPIKYELSYYSNGILPRLKAMQEASRNQGVVNHVTGDVNFIALALPSKRTILTILDCGFMRHKNKLVRNVLYWFWLKLPVAHCKYITAISEATKEEVVRYTSCSPEKIIIIPIAITTDFTFKPRNFNAERPRILHIGSAPNKNLLRHVEALRGIPCTLVIVASLKREDEKKLKTYGIAYEQYFNLTDEEVRQVYESCDMLLFASTFEGFGMPIIEAQTVGRPVVTSNCSSMPEVAGDAACFVNPLDVSDIREGVLRVINDTTYRECLVNKGVDNVKRFLPETVAEEYAKLYQAIIQESAN